MSISKFISIYYWNANHIALEMKITQTGSTGVVKKTFKAFSHGSDYEEACHSATSPEIIKKFINDLFDSTCVKKPSHIDNFWEDCSQYIREDQLNLLKALYELLLEFHAFDDDEDLLEMGASYNDNSSENFDQLFNQRNEIDDSLFKTGDERRNEALLTASLCEQLEPLVLKLETGLAPLENKRLLLNFVHEIRMNKGLGIDITSFPEKIVPRFYSRVQHLNKPRFSPFLLHIL